MTTLKRIVQFVDIRTAIFVDEIANKIFLYIDLIVESQICSYFIDPEFPALTSKIKAQKYSKQRFVSSIGNIIKTIWVFNCLGRLGGFWQYCKNILADYEQFLRAFVSCF